MKVATMKNNIRLLPPLRFAAVLTALLVFGGIVSAQDWDVDTFPMPVEAGFAPVNDIEMYYAIYGEGEPMLLIHGGLGSSDGWAEQIAPFAEEYMVIVGDGRGHGRTNFTDEPISYGLMTSDWLALLDYLEIDAIHLVGFSDGGIIGLEMAINHPDRLLSVVAYGANYDVSGVRADIGENEIFNAYIELAVGEYLELSPEPERMDAFFENIGAMWASEPAYTEEQLATIDTPILVLHGELEEAIDNDHAIEMAELIPGSEFVMMSDTGHFALWEKTEEFNEIILDFVGSVE